MNDTQTAPAPSQLDQHSARPLADDELAQIRRLIYSKRRDYAVVVAALAFVLSLVTSIVSAWTTYRKDVHDLQAQLATNVQALQDLTVRQAEIADKYKDARMAGVLNGLIVSQVNTVLHNASDLALRLGTDATTAELTTLAQGAANLGSVPEARRLLQLALAAARTANDESIALRNLGFLEIRWPTTTDMREQGQQRFREAGNLDAKYSDILQIPGVVPYLRATAEFSWADALAPIDCNAARGHYLTGRQHLASAPPIPDVEQLRRAADAETHSGLGGVSTCLPAP